MFRFILVLFHQHCSGELGLGHGVGRVQQTCSCDNNYCDFTSAHNQRASLQLWHGRAAARLFWGAAKWAGRPGVGAVNMAGHSGYAHAISSQRIKLI